MTTNALGSQPVNSFLAQAAKAMFPDQGERPLDVRSKSADGDTALHMAALWGDVAAVEQLLTAGAFVNEVGAAGRTALYYAALEGHVAVAERLVAAGADPDMVVNIGMSSRDVAAQREDKSMMELFES